MEAETSLEKQIIVKMSADGSVTVTHRLRNAGAKTRGLAPWLLRQDPKATTPQKPDEPAPLLFSTRSSCLLTMVKRNQRTVGDCKI